MTPTPSEQLVHRLAEASERCREAGSGVQKRELEWLMEAATGVTRLQWLTGSVSEPNAAWENRFESMLVRRLTGEPVQYILGTGYFYGRSFEVSPDVLIPRPETELLVEWAKNVGIGQVSPAIMDIGTGSGCIAISLALEVPGCNVTATDVSLGALKVAGRNAARHNAQVSFVESDVLSENLPRGPYSIIVSNPPYIPLSERGSLQTEVLDHEPHLALFAGADPLLFYRRISELASRNLISGGVLGVEVHADYGPDVAGLFAQQRFADPVVRTDLAGRDRIVTAVYRPES